MPSWLLIAIALASGPACADGGTTTLLKEALLCKGSPFDTLRSISAKGWSSDHAGTDFGEELSYRNVVVLKTPLRIGDATTHAVIGEVESSNEAFVGHVYGRFRGDYRQVVKELGLVEIANSTVGRFERETEPRTSTVVCPKTIGLTPKENGEFLLGCGWCNG